jgi:hypothetical protein
MEPEQKKRLRLTKARFLFCTNRKTFTTRLGRGKWILIYHQSNQIKPSCRMQLPPSDVRVATPLHWDLKLDRNSKGINVCAPYSPRLLLRCYSSIYSTALRLSFRLVCSPLGGSQTMPRDSNGGPFAFVCHCGSLTSDMHNYSEKSCARVSAFFFDYTLL